MDEVEIDSLYAQTFQAAFAGRNRPPPCRIVGGHFTDDKQTVPPLLNRLSHHFFGASLPVHFRRVDQRHTQIDPALKGCDFRCSPPPILAHFPCAQPKRRYLASARQDNRLHFSITSITRFTCNGRSIWVFPPGQSISIRSTFAAFPIPKWSLRSFCER